jgi:hypothetical protein
MAVSPSAIQLDSQFGVDGAELLPDEHLAMREGWRDGPGGRGNQDHLSATSACRDLYQTGRGNLV